jgi:hypothetical protein
MISEEWWKAVDREEAEGLPIRELSLSVSF